MNNAKGEVEVNKDNTEKMLYELAMQCNNYGYIIPKLTLPVSLYRYRGDIEYAIDEIENEHIYLSPIDKLNDPFDSSCKYTYEVALSEVMPAIYFWKGCFFLKNKTWYKELNKILMQDNIGKKEVSMEDFFLFLEEKVGMMRDGVNAKVGSKLYYFSSMNNVYRRKNGTLACFSEEGDNIIMWSHYANSHKGVCLEYEPQLLDESNPEHRSILSSIRKVWYSNLRFEDKDGMFSPFVKANAWNYEQEWRLFKESIEPEKIKFPCLKSVCLGMNFGSQINELNRIIKALSNKKRKIELYLYTPSHSEFSLKRRRIDY